MRRQRLRVADNTIKKHVRRFVIGNDSVLYRHAAKRRNY